MNGLLDGLAFCEEHGCPMLAIGGFYRCVFEYTDSLIGTRAVVDVIPAGQDTPLTLVFENGYALPLLCPDCGGPQHHRIPAEDVLAEIAGLRLIGLGYAPVDDDGPEALLLHLSSRADAEPNDEDVLTLATHAHSVTHLESINQTPPPQMSRRRRRGGKSERRR